MNEVFKVINDFIKDIWGTEFIKIPLDNKFETIKELEEAHDAIINIINRGGWPSLSELINVYPLLEISVQWNELKKSGKITANFLGHCKQRFKKHSDFYGTGFEIDMASRCILSDWDIEFPEDNGKNDESKQIDFIFYNRITNKIIGIECTSKRFTDDITIEKINEVISKKAEKFKPTQLRELGKDLNEKILIIDVTRNNYRKPEFLEYLKAIDICKELNGVVFTWRECKIKKKDCIISIEYKTIGDIDDNCFSVTYATEILFQEKGPMVLMKKHVKSVPQWAEPGPEECYIEWVLYKYGGGKLMRNELLRLSRMKPEDLDAELNELEQKGKIIRREKGTGKSSKELISLTDTAERPSGGWL